MAATHGPPSRHGAALTPRQARLLKTAVVAGLLLLSFYCLASRSSEARPTLYSGAGLEGFEDDEEGGTYGALWLAGAGGSSRRPLHPNEMCGWETALEASNIPLVFACSCVPASPSNVGPRRHLHREAVACITTNRWDWRSPPSIPMPLQSVTYDRAVEKDGWPTHYEHMISESRPLQHVFCPVCGARDQVIHFPNQNLRWAGWLSGL